MVHECGFQQEIIQVISDVSETKMCVKNMEQSIRELLSLVKSQQQEIDSLKNFKSAILGIVAFAGGIVSLITGAYYAGAYFHKS